MAVHIGAGRSLPPRSLPCQTGADNLPLRSHIERHPDYLPPWEFSTAFR